ncbi:hypothetical protein EJ06DRAFT_205971 [Trichodelitschia bisporula]|uniref:Uncharacterized protein n=1 Tax=Trichodelitschia bisporula TaxID=703511 RepID=A0A6G1I8V4_9PEZI|nr:hypothetical protein EJ06DRAFT_205971 [Trichodelitschia bisporula]
MSFGMGEGRRALDCFAGWGRARLRGFAGMEWAMGGRGTTGRRQRCWRGRDRIPHAESDVEVHHPQRQAISTSLAPVQDACPAPSLAPSPPHHHRTTHRSTNHEPVVQSQTPQPLPSLYHPPLSVPPPDLPPSSKPEPLRPAINGKKFPNRAHPAIYPPAPRSRNLTPHLPVRPEESRPRSRQVKVCTTLSPRALALHPPPGLVTDGLTADSPRAENKLTGRRSEANGLCWFLEYELHTALT